MAEPEPVCRGDRFGVEVAGGRGRRDGGHEQRVHPLGDCLEQLAGVFAVFQKAVQHEAQAGVEFGAIDAAEQKSSAP